MISGKRKIELTAEEILSKVSEYHLYRHYFGEFILNQATYNHLRGEDTHGTPSFIISNRYGHLHHKDFSDDKWSGGCFHLVQQIYNCTYNEALEAVDKDLGLGILPNHNSGLYRQIKKQYKQPEELGKRYSLIQVVTRKFTKADLAYWNSYYQTLEDLQGDSEVKIYSIKEVYLNRKKHIIPEDELKFGYFYKQGGWWKIYRPNADKKQKWISNVPLITAGGLSNISKEHNTLVTKSVKDFLVCRKIYPYVCYVQNESLNAFSEETVDYINKHSKNIFVGFDNDEAGKKASWAVTSKFRWKHINPPDKLLCENFASDWSDWAKCNNLEAIKEHFIKKKLIE